MMKRLLAVLLFAATALSFAATVHAFSYDQPRQVTDRLIWRSHNATTPTGFSGTSSDSGAADSSVATRLGTQVCPLDTTKAVVTASWWPKVMTNSWSISLYDTTQTYCSINVFDAGASFSTADSVYIACQGSYTGQDWTTLATLVGGTAASNTSRLDQTQGTGSFYGSLNRLGASGGTPSWVVTYKLRWPVTESNDMCGIWRYPLLRWIVGFPDPVKYNVGAQVIHMTSDVGN